ncbi:MAG: peroxide stress protein YaaA [Planctomycetaceae bacterium]
MLALLSPSKTLAATPRPHIAGTTTPDFLDEAETLVTRLRRYSPAELAALMDVSEKLADANHERYRNWSRPFTPENAVPAILAFRGDVYLGLEADTFDAKALAFAQKQLRILSGLYGLLRPLDLIQPYRLVMGTTFPKGRPASLYEFWDDRIADAINAAIAGQKKPTVVNLASNEYFNAVNLEALCARVITPTFKQERDGTLKHLSFFAKKARGLMARYLVNHRLKSPDGLLDFDLEGYRYNEADSTDDEPVFSRPQP